MNKRVLSINESLEKFAEKIPPKGMHLEYLDTARELMDLYGEAICILDGEEITPQEEEKVIQIAEKIKEKAE